jgi:hypothetical protein
MLSLDWMVLNKVPTVTDFANMKDDRMDITICAVKADAAVWQSMRTALWPDGAEDHAPEIAQFFAGHFFKDLTAVLVAETQSKAIVGFAELSARDDLPGPEGKRMVRQRLITASGLETLGTRAKLRSICRWSRRTTDHRQGLQQISGFDRRCIKGASGSITTFYSIEASWPSTLKMKCYEIHPCRSHERNDDH